MRTSIFRTLSALLIALAFGLASSASAGIIPGFDLQIAVETESGNPMGGSNLSALEESGLIDESENGLVTTRSLNAPVVGPNWSILSWDSQHDPDPFITNNFQVTNNTEQELPFPARFTGPSRTIKV